MTRATIIKSKLSHAKLCTLAVLVSKDGSFSALCWKEGMLALNTWIQSARLGPPFLPLHRTGIDSYIGRILSSIRVSSKQIGNHLAASVVYVNVSGLYEPKLSCGRACKADLFLDVLAAVAAISTSKSPQKQNNVHQMPSASICPPI